LAITLKIHLSIPKNLEKKPRQLFKVDKSFKTKSEVTKRTLAISEAFGLGIDDEKEFRIFKDFEFEIKPGQVVLITGDSGSGKSTLLREIISQILKYGIAEFPVGIRLDDQLDIVPQEILVDGLARGKGLTEALSLLSMAGLNEAFLMLRRFEELSDGQKYRYRLAKMNDTNADVWIFDEFCAVLDRVTAKVVSHCVQKVARKLGRTLIVSTTHEDLLEDLKPDLWIRKGFGDSVTKTIFPPNSFPQGCSILKDMKISVCESKKEIEPLEQFHYRGSNPGVPRRIFKAMIGDELAAGIIYVYPHLALKGRTIAFPEFRGPTTSESLKKLNSKLSRISRVIVAPKFRSIGLGAEIVRRTLPFAPTKYVETLAVMAKYNPFFQKAGMTRVDVPRDPAYSKAIERMESLGFQRELFGSARSNLAIIKRLKSMELEIVRSFATNYCVSKKYRQSELARKLKEGFDRDDLAKALTFAKSESVYLYWKGSD
jgi:ABC-type lipoprotein export system ATPase subunit/GNAT superfamily N-acetyltransferase